jgi:DNA (cytosine-5)-methyltransferase 1
MSAYYNEIDPKAAAWLRELIKRGLIADGEVDERSILDVRPDDLQGFAQCHFFAGIGGWSYALRLAGWSDDRPVWTGSCPCQPFSSAGKQKGFADERHLWPEWFRLIRECRPSVVFGEQVASALAWFDAVSDDMENEGYALGAADLCAAGVGAPHIRQRLWFVAHSVSERHARESILLRPAESGRFSRNLPEAARRGEISGLAESVYAERRALHVNGQDERDGQDVGRSQAHGQPGARSEVCELADADGRQSGDSELQRGWRHLQQPENAPISFWSACDWLPCRDGKYRPVEPGTFPLAHGLPARVGRLRGYGNAIVPQVAAAFVKAASGL